MATFVLKTLLSNLCILFMSLCFVLTVQSTFLNIEELQKSKYGVEISGEPVLLNTQDQDGSIMQITSKHGQQYQCILPIVHFETKESGAVNVTTEEINRLLRPLNNTCLFQLNGWWTYRVCIGISVYQYHDEGHEVKDNISLGHLSGNTDWSNVTIKEESRGDKRYHSQFYSNGTVCDLTGKPRNTELRFFCGSQTTDYISRIDESSTCNYVISIHTDKLCNHSLFRPPAAPKKHSITCSPALKEDQYKKYTEAQNIKSEKTVEEEESASDKKQKNDHNERKPDIADTLAKMYHQENIKETEYGRQLKAKEEKTTKMMNDIIAASMKRIQKLKQRKLHQDEDEEDEHSEVESDSEDEDEEEDDEVDEEDDIYEEGRKKTLKVKKDRKKMAIDEAYDEHVEDEDREDDVGWDVNSVDDENMDIEGSTSLKRNNIFSDIKKDKLSDKDDYYQELIEELKKQYSYFKKQLDSVTKDMKKRITRLEGNIGYGNPGVKPLIDAIKKSVKHLENKQRIADDAMSRLSDLYDAVMEDPDYLKANEQLASIRSTLVGLIDKSNSNSDPLQPDDHTLDENDESKDKKSQPYKPSEEIFKSDKKTQNFDMEKPKLDKVVSKLKKIMTQDNNGGDRDEFEDERISVRVTKIKERSDDLYDDKDFEKSLIESNDVRESKEMRDATERMETIVRKQLKDAGVEHDGKIKVKIITSKEALQRVAGGDDKFQILTPQETNQFRDLLSSLLGGSQQLMEEKKRQEVMEDNYNLVWNQDGFTSASRSESSLEHEDNDETRQAK